MSPRDIYRLVAHIVAFVLSSFFVTLLEYHAPPPSVWVHRAFLAFRFLWLVLSGAWFFVVFMTHTGIDEAVIFTVMYGARGAGIRDQLPLVGLALLIPCVTLFLSNVVCYLLPLVIRTPRLYKALGRAPNWLRALAVGLVVVAHPVVVQVSSILLFAPKGDPSVAGPHFLFRPSLHFAGDSFAAATVAPVRTKPPNLVLIFAESFDRMHLDELVFPGLTPGTRALEDESITFKNVQDTWGTRFSMGSKIGVQCGCPLFHPFQLRLAQEWENFVVQDENGVSHPAFARGLRCMGDILRDAGYTLEMVMGHDSRFGGEGNFALSHGFRRVIDVEDKARFTSGRLHSWGAHDDELFDVARRRVQELQSSESPFALVVETIDLHDGVSSPRCYANGRAHYPNFPNNERVDAAYCFDFLVSRFVREVASEDTMVVLLSDHTQRPHARISMVWHVGKGAPTEDPPRMLFLVHGGQVRPARINRMGSSLDIGRTVLDLMGFRGSDGVGFGRNLFNAKNQTLLEALGTIEAMDEALSWWAGDPLTSTCVWSSDPTCANFGEWEGLAPTSSPRSLRSRSDEGS